VRVGALEIQENKDFRNFAYIVATIATKALKETKVWLRQSIYSILVVL
jgi:hypothetical protein